MAVKPIRHKRILLVLFSVTLLFLPAGCGENGGDATLPGGKNEQPVVEAIQTKITYQDMKIERICAARSLGSGEDLWIAEFRVVNRLEKVTIKVPVSSLKSEEPPGSHGSMTLGPTFGFIPKLGKVWPERVIFDSLGKDRNSSLYLHPKGLESNPQRGEGYLVAVFRPEDFSLDSSPQLYQFLSQGFVKVPATRREIEESVAKTSLLFTGSPLAEDEPGKLRVQPIVRRIEEVGRGEGGVEYKFVLKGAEMLPRGVHSLKVGGAVSREVLKEAVQLDKGTATVAARFPEKLEKEAPVIMLWPELDLTVECAPSGD